jgi:hypothetical protein
VDRASAGSLTSGTGRATRLKRLIWSAVVVAVALLVAAGVLNVLHVLKGWSAVVLAAVAPVAGAIVGVGTNLVAAMIERRSDNKEATARHEIDQKLELAHRAVTGYEADQPDRPVRVHQEIDEARDEVRGVVIRKAGPQYREEREKEKDQPNQK